MGFGVGEVDEGGGDEKGRKKITMRIKKHTLSNF